MTDARTVLAYVRKHAAVTCVQIALALGVPAAYVRPALAELKRGGYVRGKGRTQGVRYTAT